METIKLSTTLAILNTCEMVHQKVLRSQCGWLIGELAVCSWKDQFQFKCHSIYSSRTGREVSLKINYTFPEE